MEDIKEEKRQAKLQDKAFVDYRKEEILQRIQPKNKSFSLKKFDDHRPDRKKKANMEFGQLMHNYLMQRPDARFATWFGKEAELKMKREAAASTAASKASEKVPRDGGKEGGKGMLKKMVAVIPGGGKKQKSPSQVKRTSGKITDEVQNLDFKEDEDDEERKKGAFASLKLDVEEKVPYDFGAVVLDESKGRKMPFWLRGDPDVPPEEEESYVDAEMLTNYAADPDTKKYPCNLAERKQFFVWGPLAQLNSAKLAHFQKQELVIGNTLKSIVDSSADKIGIAKERINKHHKPMIKWSEKTSIIDFVMDPPEQVLQKTEIRDGKLQNIRKEDAAKRE